MTLHTIARITVRDAIRAPGRFALALCAVATAIAALGAADGAVDAFAQLMSQNLAPWIASDLCVITGENLTPAQAAVLESLQREGLPMARLEDTIANVSTERRPDPVLSLVRVADDRYPLRGALRLNPPVPRGRGTLASRTALARLDLHVGDRVYINGQESRISAEIESLPDQLTLPPTLLPFFLVKELPNGDAQRGFDYLRFLFRLPDMTQLDVYRSRLADAFPGRKILDALHPDDQVTLTLNLTRAAMRAFTWLAFLIALVSVQISLWSRLGAGLDTVAMLKCLGAGPRQLGIWIVAEPFLLLAFSSVIGLGLAILFERAIVNGVAAFLGYTGVPPFAWQGPLRAALVAPAVGLLFLAPFFDRLRRARPGRVLRRNAAPQAAIRWRPAVGPLAWRYALSNLVRRGNFAGVALVTLSSAVALAIAIWTIQHAAAREIEENFPSDSGLLLINVPPSQRAEIGAMLERDLGALGPPLFVPYFALRLISIDGRPNPSAAFGLNRRWLAAQSGDPAKLAPFLAGVNWNPSRTLPEVLAPRSVAEALGAQLGADLEFESTQGRWHARLTQVVAAGPLLLARCCFVFNSAVPTQPAAALHGVVKLPPSQVLPAQRKLYQTAPLMSSVDLATPYTAFAAWLQSLLLALRMLAALLGIAALTLFAGTIVASRQWRRTEIAIYQALGATTGKVLQIAALEFALLGLAAGLIGSAISAPAVTYAWNRFVEGHAAYPSLWLYPITATLSAGVATIVGILSVYPQVRRKPLESLREA